MPVKFKNEVSLDALNNATTDTDKFLVSDSGIVKYRTGTQLLSDLGVSGLYVPYTGAIGNVDLGTHTLSSYNLIINHTSGSGVAASITKGGSGEALTINKTSGSGNAVSVLGGLTSLVDLTLSSILNATIDTDRFIVSDGGAIKYRTGAQVLSDIGGQAALTNPITGTGTTNYVSKFTGANSLGNSLIFDNGTNVGIGTTSPSTRLDVVGSIKASQSLTIGTGGNYEVGTIYSDANWGMIFRARQASPINAQFMWADSLDNELMRIKNGNVGIGTTSPADKLSVAGIIGSYSGASNLKFNPFANNSNKINSTNFLAIQDDTTNAVGIGYNSDTNPGGPSAKLWVNGGIYNSTGLHNVGTGYFGGNVGIGTTSPSAKLSLFDTSDLWVNISRGSSFVNIGVDATGTFYNTNSNHRFLYNAGSNEAMRITSSGNVGIGTSTPTQTLEVAGTVLITTPGFPAGQLYFGNTSTFITASPVMATMNLGLVGTTFVELNSMTNRVTFYKTISLPFSTQIRDYTGAEGNVDQVLTRDASGPIWADASGGGGIVDITRGDLILARNDSALVPGTKYKITDSLQGYVYNLNSIPVIMNAISTNQFEIYSTGLFYTVQYNKYNMYWGIWNTIVNAQLTNFSGQGYFYTGEQIQSNTGATGQYYGQQMIVWTGGNWAGSTSVTGLWSSVTATISNSGSIIQPSYSSGQYVRWGGQIWENISGSLGSDVSGSYGFPYGYVLSPSDWQVYTSAGAPGFYNSTPDLVIYDLDKDIITYREDSLGNKIYESENIINSPSQKPYSNIFKFQWGSFANTEAGYGYYSCYGNIAYTNTYINNVNAASAIYNNTLKGNSYIDNQYFQGQIYNNDLIGNSSIDTNAATNWSAQICRNTLSGYGQVYGNDLYSSQVASNILNTGSISNNSAEYGMYIDGNVITGGGGIFNNSGSGYLGFTNNRFDQGNINNNRIINCYVSDNSFNRGAYLYGNTFTNTQFYNNTLNTVQMNQNTFTNTAFEYNILTFTNIDNNNCSNTSGSDQGGINYNQTFAPNGLNYNTQRNIISNNTLGTNSRIVNNQLSSGSKIQSNTINSGNIASNVLNLKSSINFNTISSGLIENNTISNTGRIDSNQMPYGNGSINDNNITQSNASISYNYFYSGYIRYNNLIGANSTVNTITLYSGEISSNELGYNCSMTSISVYNFYGVMQCIFKDSASLQMQSFSTDSIQYTTFQNTLVNMSLSSATIIYNNSFNKIVYNDPSFGNTISFYKDWMVNFDYVTS